MASLATRGAGQKSGICARTDRWLSHSGIFFSRDRIFGPLRQRSSRIRESNQRGSRQRQEKSSIIYPRGWGAVQNSGKLANRTGTRTFSRVSGFIFFAYRIGQMLDAIESER
jgi:hypothetical protein